jgi:hypothetical protein
LSRRRLGRPVLVALLAATIAIAGCTSAASPSGKSTTTPTKASTTTTAAGSPSSVVTEAEMAAILAKTMATNNQANKTEDLSLLKSYEAGSALAIDAASYAETGTQPVTACSYLPFGVHLVQAVAQPGASYPERFLAVGGTYPIKTAAKCATGACPDADTLLEFQKDSANAPWQIVIEPSANNGAFAKLAASGSEAALLTAATQKAAKSVPGFIAAALQTYEASGSLGPLKANDFTGSCWQLPDPYASSQQEKKSGISENESFTPASDMAAYPMAGGGALVIFTLDTVTQLLPSTPGSSIGWVSDPSVDPVTGLLPSGQYRRVDEKGALQIAVETRASGGGVVVGDYGGTTSISGVKAPGTPPTTGGGGVLVSLRRQ